MLSLAKAFYILLLLNIILADLIKQATCVEKDGKIYAYGGISNKASNSKLLSVNLKEGLTLKAEKVDWKVEYEFNNAPIMRDVKGFDLGNQTNLILNFGGKQDELIFNTLNTETYQFTKVTKGLKELYKILKLPKGLNKDTKLFHYKFIQSDVQPTKFYLYDIRISKPDEVVDFMEVLEYDAISETWKNTKRKISTTGQSFALTYNDVIYNFVDESFGSSESSFKFDLNDSKPWAIQPKGDKLPNDSDYSYVAYKNQFYITFHKPQKLNYIYNLNLKTLEWKKHLIDGLSSQSGSAMIYYNNNVILLFGGSEKTQVISTTKWTKEDGIKAAESSVLDRKAGENSKDNGINIPALVGGLVGGAVLIILIGLGIFYYFYKKRKALEIEPPEYISEHQVIEVTNHLGQNEPLAFRFSAISNPGDKKEVWDFRMPQKVLASKTDSSLPLMCSSKSSKFPASL